MARVEGLSEVSSASGECAKFRCKTGAHTLHRHHRKHEAMWIGVWVARRAGEEKFYEFTQRYHAFDKRDWTVVCANHHAEIHLIYDEIIKKDKLKTGRPLSKYSWTQAEKLMDKLEATCLLWLKKDTPGLSPEELNKLRARRITLAMNAKGETKYVGASGRRA